MVMSTGWDLCRALNPDCVTCLLRQPVIVGSRNILRPGQMHKQGVCSYSIGREGVWRKPGPPERASTHRGGAGEGVSPACKTNFHSSETSGRIA